MADKNILPIFAISFSCKKIDCHKLAERKREGRHGGSLVAQRGHGLYNASTGEGGNRAQVAQEEHKGAQRELG